MSQDEIETGNASLIAQDDSVKRQYMTKGVRRIEIKVTNIQYVFFVFKISYNSNPGNIINNVEFNVP